MSNTDLENWNPMADDYASQKFNSYTDGHNQQQDLRSLYIRSVPAGLAEDAFTSIFSENGRRIRRHCLYPVRKGYTVTCGLVSFDSERDAADAFRNLHGKPPYNFQICYAKKKDNSATLRESNSNLLALNHVQTAENMHGMGRGQIIDSKKLSPLKIVLDGDKRTSFHGQAKIDNKEAKHLSSNTLPELIPNRYLFCLNCQKIAQLSCGICKEPYCSLTCQKGDREKHKDNCKSMPNAPQTESDHCKPKAKLSNDSSYMSESSCSDGEKKLHPAPSPSSLVRNRNTIKSPPCASVGQRRSSAEPSKDIHNKPYNSIPEKKFPMRADDIEKIALTLTRNEKIYVSYVESPAKFWVQLETADKILSRMEKDISECDKSPNLQCTIDDICFTKQNEKYRRVKVLDTNPTTSLVFFLDYGGTSSVKNEALYYLPHKFKSYSAQAVCCNLVDTDDHEIGNWNADDISSFRFYTTGKWYKAHVHRCSNEVYDVSLVNDDGLSLYSILALSRNETTCEDNSELKGLSEVPSVWTTLKEGDNHTVAAVEFEADKFWGILDDGSNCTKVLEDTEKLLENLNTEEINMYCEVKDIAAGFSVSFNQYFRCIVLERRRSSFLVRYIDYGNQEEIKNLRSLPVNILKMKSYVVCCQKPDSMSKDDFKAFFEKPIPMVVKSVKNCVVELSFEFQNNWLSLSCFPWYHGVISGKTSDATKNPSILIKEKGEAIISESQKISSQEIPRKVTSPPKQPKRATVSDIPEKQIEIGVSYQVKIGFIIAANEIYVQFNSDEKDTVTLGEQLNQFCNSNISLKRYTPLKDEIVCCKYSADGNWYRGQVVARRGTLFRVFFIDFGNFEEGVTGCDMKPLPENFYIPKLCVRVSLHNVLNKDLSTDLLKKLIEEVWVMERKDEAKLPAEVMFYQGKKSLSDMINDSKIKNPILSSFKKLTLQNGTNEVLFCHEENELKYCNLVSKAESLDLMSKKLDSCPNIKTLSMKPAVGDVVCAKSSDGHFYRAAVKCVYGASFEVVYIDFGNSEKVEGKNVMYLPKEFHDFPIFGIQVKIVNLDKVKTKVDFSSILSIKAAGFSSDQLQLVELVLPGSSLPNISSLKPKVISLGQEVEVSLCFAKDDIFYAHLTSLNELIVSLQSKMEKAGEFKDISILPEIGDVVAAKFTDGIWYRGSIVKASEKIKSCEIFFFDYGNSEIIDLENMKVLPISLCTFPIFAVPMKFKSIEELQNQLQSVEPLLTVKCVERSGDHYVVEVVLPKNESISSIEIPVLPSEAVEVIVSFKEGNTYFVQKLSDTEKLQEMMLRLQQANLLKNVSPKMGEQLAVKFSDGLFYRGVVKKINGNDQFDVFFVDYGNTDMVHVRDIYTLPSDYSTLPAFCVPIVINNSNDTKPLSIDSNCIVKYIKTVDNAQLVQVCPPVTSIMFASLETNSLEEGVSEVVFEQSDGQFYFLNKTSDLNKIQDMKDKLEKFTGDMIHHIPLVNEVLLVNKNNLWHRGYIRQTDELSKTCEVYLFDLGVIEHISYSNISYVPEIIKSLPIFLTKVLIDSDKTAKRTISFGKCYNVFVAKQNAEGIPVVKIFQQYFFPSIKRKQVSLCELSEVAFVHQESDIFFLQILKDHPLIAEMQVEVDKCALSQAICRKLQVGELLCAYSSAYQQWYRACIEEVVTCDTYKVYFIDFGNSEVVSKDNLREFTAELSMYPSFSTAVKVNQAYTMPIDINKQYTVIAESEPEENIQKIKIVHPQVTSIDETRTNIVETREEKQVVSIKEVVSNPSKFSFSTCKYVPFPPGEQDIVIYTIGESSYVFCAPFVVKNIQESFELSSRIADYTRNLKCTSYDGDSLPDQDEMVLAMYKEDRMWYRAVIVENKSHPLYCVIFVDYGNTETLHLDSLRKMTAQLMDLEIQAHLCLLAGFKVLEENSNSVIEELKSFTTLSRPEPLKAVINKSGEELVVNIPTITNHLIGKNLAIAESS